jgi:trehalose/maltose transport system permease protein
VSTAPAYSHHHVPAAGARAAQRVPLTDRRVRLAWLFLVPTLVVLLATAGWPLLRTMWFSLTDANLTAAEPPAFIGLGNYTALVTDPMWWRAVANTALFALASVALEVALGLAIALVLNVPWRGQGLLRAAVLVPWAVPTVVSAKMWAWMLHDLYGVVNALLLQAGLIAEPIAWAASPRTAFPAVVLVDVWKTTPFVAILTLAALQMVPRVLYEAARVDGAGAFTCFRRITLPMIRPALLVALTFRALDALRIFDIIYVLTGTREDTMTMSIYVRQQLVDFQDTGYGSAAATFVFFLVALATALYVMSVRVRAEGVRR